MSNKMPEGFADLHKLPEDQRITLIGTYVMTSGKVAGVCIEDDRDKIARYCRKFREQFPLIVIGLPKLLRLGIVILNVSAPPGTVKTQ